MFTIEAGSHINHGVNYQVIGRFSATTWDTLWGELEVSPERWREWRIAVDAAQKNIPLLQEFPQISCLAYIDEGAVRFDVKALSEECKRLAVLVTSEETRRLIAELLEAATVASLDEGSEVVVHPFG
jgi:hypothetical protein